MNLGKKERERKSFVFLGIPFSFISDIESECYYLVLTIKAEP